MSKLHLPQVTVVAITDRDHGKTIEALLKTLDQIEPARTVLFSNVKIDNPLFETLLIGQLGSARAYNEFVTWELGPYIHTSHILIVQFDGYVIDASAWTDEFLQYDYIGAPWTYTDGRNVGNGGFSLRTKRLHDILSSDPKINIGSPEDEIICRLFRHYLEETHGIRYAPEALAHRFSYEMHRPLQKTFGFHNSAFAPYREPIVMRRSYAMGDVIMLEPVMEYFYNKGHRIILDSIPSFFNLFANHHYPVEHVYFLGNEDWSAYRLINFDMAYEVMPKQLVLKSYCQVAGIQDLELRNSRLNFSPTPNTKLFDKYVVVHLGGSDLPHRNVRGIKWDRVENFLRTMGYVVIQVGKEEIKTPVGTKINAYSENMLAYIICGADLFIGVDSGPAQIAVATGVKSVIFFGSVNPEYRYHNLNKIVYIKNSCQFAGCYHNAISEKGVDCVINKELPPCTELETGQVINCITKALSL